MPLLLASLKDSRKTWDPAPSSVPGAFRGRLGGALWISSSTQTDGFFSCYFVFLRSGDFFDIEGEMFIYLVYGSNIKVSISYCRSSQNLSLPVLLLGSESSDFSPGASHQLPSHPTQTAAPAGPQGPSLWNSAEFVHPGLSAGLSYARIAISKNQTTRSVSFKFRQKNLKIPPNQHLHRSNKRRLESIDPRTYGKTWSPP